MASDIRVYATMPDGDFGSQQIPITHQSAWLRGRHEDGWLTMARDSTRGYLWRFNDPVVLERCRALVEEVPNIHRWVGNRSFVPIYTTLPRAMQAPYMADLCAINNAVVVGALAEASDLGWVKKIGSGVYTWDNPPKNLAPLLDAYQNHCARQGNSDTAACVYQTGREALWSEPTNTGNPHLQEIQVPTPGGDAIGYGIFERDLNLVDLHLLGARLFLGTPFTEEPVFDDAVASWLGDQLPWRLLRDELVVRQLFASYNMLSCWQPTYERMVSNLATGKPQQLSASVWHPRRYYHRLNKIYNSRQGYGKW